MTPRFLAFIPFVLEWETEFNRDGSVKVERDPDDPGGTTKYGIDQRSHPRVNIAALDESGAKLIYFGEWMKFLCEELPSPFGEMVFDIRVNGGPAIGFLQQALVDAGCANFNRRAFPIDGFCGPLTIRASETALADYRLAQEVIGGICDQRNARYRRLAKRAAFSKFLKGWLNRSEALRTRALAPLDATRTAA